MQATGATFVPLAWLVIVRLVLREFGLAQGKGLVIPLARVFMVSVECCFIGSEAAKQIFCEMMLASDKWVEILKDFFGGKY